MTSMVNTSQSGCESNYAEEFAVRQGKLHFIATARGFLYIKYIIISWGRTRWYRQTIGRKAFFIQLVVILWKLRFNSGNKITSKIMIDLNRMAL